MPDQQIKRIGRLKYFALVAKLLWRKCKKKQFFQEETLKCITLYPLARPTYCVIGLHGLGASGRALVEFAMALPVEQPIRWVFPHAPIRTVSLCGHVEMPAWYDVYGRGIDSHEDVQGVQAASLVIHQLITQEIQRGIPAERIILAGFSQGAALALYSGLRYPERLGGIVSLAGYLPLAKQLAIEAHPANQTTSIFMAQGEFDTAVPKALGEASLHYLKLLGCLVTFQSYPIGHTICLREVIDISLWLDRQAIAAYSGT